MCAALQVNLVLDTKLKFALTSASHFHSVRCVVGAVYRNGKDRKTETARAEKLKRQGPVVRRCYDISMETFQQRHVKHDYFSTVHVYQWCIF